MKFILRIFITALALMMTAYLVPGIAVANIYVALVAALVLGFLNSIVRPLLIILTLPATFLSLGLFIFVINAVLFWFASSLINGFTVAGFLPALVGSILVAILSTLANKIIT